MRLKLALAVTWLILPVAAALPAGLWVSDGCALSDLHPTPPGYNLARCYSGVMFRNGEAWFEVDTLPPPGAVCSTIVNRYEVSLLHLPPTDQIRVRVLHFNGAESVRFSEAGKVHIVFKADYCTRFEVELFGSSIAHLSVASLEMKRYG